MRDARAALFFAGTPGMEPACRVHLPAAQLGGAGRAGGRSRTTFWRVPPPPCQASAKREGAPFHSHALPCRGAASRTPLFLSAVGESTHFTSGPTWAVRARPGGPVSEGSDGLASWREKGSQSADPASPRTAPPQPALYPCLRPGVDGAYSDVVKAPICCVPPSHPFLSLCSPMPIHPSTPPHRRAGHGQDRPRPRHRPRAGLPRPVLPARRVRGLLRGGQEDGRPDGALPAGDR